MRRHLIFVRSQPVCTAQPYQSHTSALSAGPQPWRTPKPNATSGCLLSLSAASKMEMLVFLKINALILRMHIESDSSGIDWDKQESFIESLYWKSLMRSSCFINDHEHEGPGGCGVWGPWPLALLAKTASKLPGTSALCQNQKNPELVTAGRQTAATSQHTVASKWLVTLSELKVFQSEKLYAAMVHAQDKESRCSCLLPYPCSHMLTK